MNVTDCSAIKQKPDKFQNYVKTNSVLLAKRDIKSNFMWIYPRFLKSRCLGYYIDSIYISESIVLNLLKLLHL